MYFDAALSRIYIDDYFKDKIIFGFSDNDLNRENFQRAVFDICLKYGEIKLIEFHNNNAVVKFKENIF